MIDAHDILRTYLRGLLELETIEAAGLWSPSVAEGAPVHLREGRGGLGPSDSANVMTRLAKRLRQSGLRSSLPAVEPVELKASEEGADEPRLRVVRILLAADEAEGPRRRKADSTSLSIRPVETYLTLRFADPEAAEELEPDTDDWWRPVAVLGARLARHCRDVGAVLNDPVTGIPGRAGLHGRLSAELARSRATGEPLSLLLVSPDDFALINQRYGHRDGDRVLREITGQLVAVLRKSDLAARHGGAILAAVLPETDARACRLVARKLLDALSDRTYRDDSLQLGFRCGLATYSPSHEKLDDVLELVCRAEEALFHSRRSQGDRLIEWTPELERVALGADDLTGFFTGNMAKDYRNMQLLGEVVRVVASSSDFGELADMAVARLYETLDPNRLQLFEISDDGGLRLIGGRGHDGEVVDDEDSPRIASLLDAARAELRPMTQTVGQDGERLFSCAIPMVVGSEALGGLYLEGAVEKFSLDSSDLIFLRSLTAQLAVALDRARLSTQEKKRQERERERLEAEVEELRKAVQKANLEYRSEAMESVMATLRRVAPTEATVLVTGESGTGKELIARTLHQLSGRRQRPLVIVDCAAIPPTLIENELFGHERGAFSGANQRRIGRLEEADGGTVFLDEIGELPLEVQSKLLRFVQEKQLSRIGSTQTRSVDVRVIAATNRELRREVEAGRFREDLYYRLNVVRVRVPALRDRPDDILHLAYHYLRTYAVLYRKETSAFTPEAEVLLCGYEWPGNVRELQNRVQRAVILGEAAEVGPTALAIDASETAGGPHAGRRSETDDAVSTPGDESRLPVRFAESRTAGNETRRGPEATGESGSLGANGPGLDLETLDDAFESLRHLLVPRVDQVVSRQAPAVPIGTWLAEDLVIAADQASDGVGCRAAELLGLPETTYRRRRAKAERAREAGLAPRPPWWGPVRGVLDWMVHHGEGHDLTADCQRLLLEELVHRVSDRKTGAALLGVTGATYRRRCESLERQSTPSAATA